MGEYSERFASAAPFLIVGGNVAWYYGTRALYNAMEPPPEEVSKSSSERVIWALARALPPIALATFLGFEMKAFTYTQEGNEPLPSLAAANTTGTPSAVEIIDRIQKHTLDQSFMTTITAVAAAYWVKDVKGVDARIAPAMSLMYCLCRPLFASGYMTALMLRAPGLFAGGFWMNGVVAVYAMLLHSGVKDSPQLRKRVFIGMPAGIFAALLLVFLRAG